MTQPTPVLPYVLVVEDDTATRAMLHELLTTEGYGVVSVTGGTGALAHLQHAPPPALILLDLIMPSMNGYEFRAIQRHHPQWASIPVVVMTASNAMREPAAQLLDPAASLTKPLNIEHLLQLVATYLEAD